MEKKEKDILHGLNYKVAMGLGVVLYLISRFAFGDVSGDIIGLTVVTIFQVAGVVFFVVGLYRWNKAIKEKKRLARAEEETQ